MTFYFYDLETSGISPRRDRIMQFAGQRTDMNLKPIGEPDNFLIKMTPDVLPQPEAILITGITPQKTVSEGISEAEAIKYLTSQVFTPDTIAVGFNNIRFDDEFVRFMSWRNFTDAYEWQWKDGRSKWDLLDVVRMMRALRPDGIKWPFASDGKPTNRLSFLTELNKLEHASAHDALSDVVAAIELAKLIRGKQPKLFDYLLNMRSKQKVAALVDTNQPFIYTSGRYPSEFLHTSVVIKLADHPDRGGAAIVYDLRVNPKDLLDLSPKELSDKWSAYGKDTPYFPVKMLAYNRCPAVAPLNTLDAKSAERLKISKTKIEANLKLLSQDFVKKLVEAANLMKKAQQAELVSDPLTVDEQLYDGFVSDGDRVKMSALRAADSTNIGKFDLEFGDKRLSNLLPLYKARNFPKVLTEQEQEVWEKFRAQRLLHGGQKGALAEYFARIEELIAGQRQKDVDKYVLEELRLYGESIAPS